MKMKKKAFLRALIGAPIGLTISVVITILVSVSIGDGKFYPVQPELTALCGRELTAVALQTAASLLYGAVWAAASVIWETDWSLLRQTLTHLLTCSLSALPVAYLMYWMPHNVRGILLYFGIFLGIYVSIWASQFFAARARVRKLNEKLHKKE